MTDFALVSEYVDLAQRTRSVSELEARTEAIVRELGFDYFAILHHLDLSQPGADPGPGEVRFSNYPASWRGAIQKQRLVGVDPVLTASQRTAHGFLWSRVPGMIELSPRQREILELAKREGLAEGYTVPIHVPGEFFGSASFGVRTGREVREASLPLLHYLGSYAFEAGRRLTSGASTTPDQAPALTDRQLDCIVLAGQGKSARRASMLLGIKQDTFQKHMDEAKHRLGVRTTTEVVVRSLFDGRIAFRDILDKSETNS